MEKIKSAVEAVKGADTISFSSTIDSTDALLLSNIAKNVGAKLFCKECYGYNTFLDFFGSNLKIELNNCDTIIAFGSRFLDNHPDIAKEIEEAVDNGSELIYMHPIEDNRLKGVKQFIKYEPGSEEGVAALLLETLTRDKELPNSLKEYIDELDIGFISGESSISEEEMDELFDGVKDKKCVAIVVGSDIYNHEKVENIAKILSAIKRFADVKIYIAPPYNGAKGLKNIYTLSKEAVGKIVDIDNLDVLLSEIAKELGIEAKKSIEIKELKNLELCDVDELPSFDGVVIYCVDNLHTKKLIGTKQFAMAAKLSEGDIVEFKIGSSSLKRVFIIDTSLKGTIALNPTFDIGLSSFTVSSYRFCKIDINKVGSANE